MACEESLKITTQKIRSDLDSWSRKLNSSSKEIKISKVFYTCESLKCLYIALPCNGTAFHCYFHSMSYFFFFLVPQLVLFCSTHLWDTVDGLERICENYDYFNYILIDLDCSSRGWKVWGQKKESKVFAHGRDFPLCDFYIALPFNKGSTHNCYEQAVM
jgi:hypothetical protein